jgi:hypothetical protein
MNPITQLDLGGEAAGADYRWAVGDHGYVLPLSYPYTI